MWPEFWLTILCMFAVTEVPGFFLLRALKFNTSWALCAAPLAGLSLLAIVGQVFALAGISLNAYVLAAITLAFAVLLFALLRVFNLRGVRIDMRLPKIDWRIMLLSLVFGAGLGYNLFLSRLGTLDALFQSYDVTQHLNIIQSMADSGRYTSLGVSPYMSTADATIAPVDYSGFYPAGWHALCAVAVAMVNTTVTLSINASMYFLACLVFPVGVNLFITTIFDDKRWQLAGALVGLAFVSFPWFLLTFGPVYANVAGFSLMPIIMAMFVLMFGKYEALQQAPVSIVITMLFCFMGVALCHPNVIFSCIALLAPFCVRRIWEVCSEKNMRRLKRLCFCAGFVVFCLAFWVICYKLPIFASTVSAIWPSHTTTFQAVINVLSGAYAFGFSYEITAQIVLALLVIIGAVKLIYTPNLRWLVVSYALMCGILIYSGTHNNTLKQIIAGFWYTDPSRLAALCAIAAIPLAAVGAERLFCFAEYLWNLLPVRQGRAQHSIVFGTLIACVFLVINFAPAFNFAGIHYQYTEEEKEEYEYLNAAKWPKTVHTTFGDYREIVTDTYAKTNPLTSLEKKFIGAASAMVDDEGLVINNPMDGSFLSYGLKGLRVYYRNFVGFGGRNEAEESAVIRTRLCDYATDTEVQDAVKAIGAKYVIQLEDGIENSGFINLREDYDSSLFVGISSITPDTPGFTCVYSSFGLKLYKIDEL